MAEATGQPTTERDGGSPAVFLSYSREDQARAREVIALLHGSGLTVWWDELLEGGVNYLPATEQALQTAACVVVLWSKISVDSYWVRDEAQEGRERDCLVPLSLDGSMPPLGFRQFQVIDISRWNGDLASPEAERIRRAVLARCGCAVDGGAQVLPHTPVRPAVRMNRRTAIALGTGAGVLALGGAAWMGGLISSPAEANSIAVMPFRNVSNNPEEKFFSDGLSSEVRVVLARNPGLRVAAPASSETIAEDGDGALELARGLGMANLLRGSVQRAGDKVRVSAELVNTQDSVVRWAERFDRDLSDVFAVQSDIAEQVVVALVSKIGENRNEGAVSQSLGGTRSVPAYDAYLRGRALYELASGEDSDRAALAQFDAAVASDPRYAAAHAMRATMLAAMAGGISERGAVERMYGEAIDAAQRAIGIEPKLAMAHLALGYALNNGRLDPRGARPEYARARELAPGDADILRSVASFDAFDERGAEAKALIDQVLSLDPLNARAFRSAGDIALAGRDPARAQRHFEKALELNPDIAIVHFSLACAQVLRGDFAAAVINSRKEPVRIFALTIEAIAHARMGNDAEADRALADLVGEWGDNALYQQAQVLAQRGRVSEALDRLGAAVRLRDPGLLLARTDAFLDPLRKQPEFSRLLGVVRA